MLFILKGKSNPIRGSSAGDKLRVFCRRYIADLLRGDKFLSGLSGCNAGKTLRLFK